MPLIDKLERLVGDDVSELSLRVEGIMEIDESFCRGVVKRLREVNERKT